MGKKQFPLMSWGIPVHIVSGHNPTKPEMTRLFAEVVPAPPFLAWVGFHRKGWRRLIPFTNGRYNPISRWWFEVQETNGYTWAYKPYGSGGSLTLRGCVSKAIDAVEEATTHLIDNEPH